MDDELVEGVNIEGGPCGNLIEIQSGNWPLPKTKNHVGIWKENLTTKLILFLILEGVLVFSELIFLHVFFFPS